MGNLPRALTVPVVKPCGPAVLSCAVTPQRLQLIPGREMNYRTPGLSIAVRARARAASASR